MPKILDISVNRKKDTGVISFSIFLDEPIDECVCFEFCKEYETDYILIDGKREHTTNNKYNNRLRNLILKHGKIYCCGLYAEHVMDDFGVIMGHISP